MAKVTKTVTVTKVSVLVADAQAKTVSEVSTVFVGKKKVNKRMIKTLQESAEQSGLKFIEVSHISYEKEKYEMPLEMFVQMAKRVEE